MKHTTYNFDSYLKCTILFHQVRSQCCAAVNVVYFQAFSSPQEQNVNHEKSLPILCPLPPLPLAIHSSTSCIYGFSSGQFSSVAQSCPTLRRHEMQHVRPPCPSAAPGVYSNSHPLSQRCDPTISSSVIPFSSCLQSFPASGSYLMRVLFASGGQSIGVSTSASVFPINIQDWFPLGLISIYISHIYQGYTRDALTLECIYWLFILPDMLLSPDNHTAHYFVVDWITDFNSLSLHTSIFLLHPG